MKADCTCFLRCARCGERMNFCRCPSGRTQELESVDGSEAEQTDDRHGGHVIERERVCAAWRARRAVEIARVAVEDPRPAAQLASERAASRIVV